MMGSKSSLATAPPHAASPPDPAATPAELRRLSVRRLLSFLRSSFRDSDFEEVEQILVSREASLEAELAEALALKKLEGIEFSREADALRAKCSKAEEEREASAREVEKYRGICAGFEEQAGRTSERLAVLAEEIRELEKAKKSAMDEAEEWKRKYLELDARLRAKEERKPAPWVIEVAPDRKKDRVRQSAARIVFGDVIEISDGEDEMHANDGASKGSVLGGDFGAKSAKSVPVDGLNAGVLKDDDRRVFDDERIVFSITPKRKCASRVVTSDIEGEVDDDSMPIGSFKRRRLGETIAGAKESDNLPADNSCNFNGVEEDVTLSRRRLFRLKECCGKKGGEKGDATTHNLIPDSAGRVESGRVASVYRKLAYSGEEDDEVEGADEGKETDDSGSESEGESLGGFIVNNSDVETSSSSDGESDSSDEDLDLNKVLAKIRREKETKNWEYEADMLARFAKDSELCMKAVCALYRQQTFEEQSIKGSLIRNERGFNKFDAARGSMIAEFLTGGNPCGPLKSIAELNSFLPNGVEYCRELALFYSKQLFKIYQNKEDPLFLLS